MRFVHLAPASQERRIARSGLAGSRASVLVGESQAIVPKAVFAMPVVADFWTTYQWLRELRRAHDERVVAAYFRIPDGERVLAGRYGQPHLEMTASASALWVMQNPNGAEVVVPRSVSRSEVLRTRALTQLVGWTEVPEQENRGRCLCPACVPRGARDLMRRVRGAITEGMLAAREARTVDDVVSALGRLEIPLERARGRIEPRGLLVYAKSREARVRQCAAGLLANFRRGQVEATLLALASDSDSGVSEEAVRALTRACGLRRAATLLEDAPESVAMRMLDQAEYETDHLAAASALETAVGHPASAVAKRAEEIAVALLVEAEVDGAAHSLLRELALRAGRRARGAPGRG